MTLLMVVGDFRMPSAGYLSSVRRCMVNVVGGWVNVNVSVVRRRLVIVGCRLGSEHRVFKGIE